MKKVLTRGDKWLIGISSALLVASTAGMTILFLNVREMNADVAAMQAKTKKLNEELDKKIQLLKEKNAELRLRIEAEGVKPHEPNESTYFEAVPRRD